MAKWLNSGYWNKRWSLLGRGVGRGMFLVKLLFFWWEGDNRGWDGCMASLTQWTWVWVNSGSWWWTGRPGMLLFMGSQRVGHDWVTELHWSLPSRSLQKPLRFIHQRADRKSKKNHSTTTAKNHIRESSSWWKSRKLCTIFTIIILDFFLEGCLTPVHLVVLSSGT